MAMPGLPESEATIECGRFKVIRLKRELLADGWRVELGGRTFDTLVALIIRTVAGRGYQFTGEIRASMATAAAAAPSRVTNLPEAVSELIGREAELRDAMDLVTKHRLVTLIGAGGIGKTRLGLEVARHLVPTFPDGVFVAGLGPLLNSLR